MSVFIDKLKWLSRAAPQQSIGFRAAQPASPIPKLQLVASLPQESVESLTDHTAGADAGLLRISRPGSAAKTLKEVSRTTSDIPWGWWLPGSGLKTTKQTSKSGYDFIVFPAADTPLALLQDGEAGKILEVATSLGEGLLRTTNTLPVDAVLVTSEQPEELSLTWQNLMLFRRFAALLTKPLLATIPSGVTAAELQALWEAGVSGVVTEIKDGQPEDSLKKLRQVIDKLTVPSPRRQEKIEPRLPGTSQEPGQTTIEEEDEEED